MSDGAVILLPTFVVVHPLQYLLHTCCHRNGRTHAVRAVQRVIQILDVQVDFKARGSIGLIASSVPCA